MPGPLPDGFIDESVDHRSCYVMAYVGRPTSRPLVGLLRDLEQIAAQGPYAPRTNLHTVELSQAQRDAAESAVSASQPESMVVVRSPIGCNIEQARQVCVAELVTRLSSDGVRSVVFDTRDDLARSIRRTQNGLDNQTIYDLREAGEIAPDFKHRHVDDRHEHGLWLPDLVAHAARRALIHEDPAQLAPFAARLHLIEATLLPVSQRSSARPSGPVRDPQGQVARYLDNTWVRAAAASAVDPADPVGGRHIHAARQLLQRAQDLGLAQASAMPRHAASPTGRSPSLLDRVKERLAALDAPPPGPTSPTAAVVRPDSPSPDRAH